jgi:hypothetical protein
MQSGANLPPEAQGSNGPVNATLEARAKLAIERHRAAQRRSREHLALIEQALRSLR